MHIGKGKLTYCTSLVEYMYLCVFLMYKYAGRVNGTHFSALWDANVSCALEIHNMHISKGERIFPLYVQSLI